MLIPAMENLGVVQCYEYTDWDSTVRPSDEPGYQGEQYLVGPGTITLERWTPNALSYQVDAPGPTLIVINQNFDSGWRIASGAGEIVSYEGLIGVHVPAGIQIVKLHYISVAFLIGAAVSLLTLVLAIIVVRVMSVPENTPSYAGRRDTAS